MGELDSQSNNFIFRYFRFYQCILVCRIFRLCHYLDYMNFIMEVVWKSFRLFFNLAFLFSLVLIFFSLLGREFFKTYFVETRFTTFATSFISVFQIITLDSWYDFLADDPMSLSQTIYVSIYVISLIFIGNYLFLNLFLTIIIDVFQSKQEQINEEKEDHKKQIETHNISKSKIMGEKRRKAITMTTPKIELEINSAIKSIKINKVNSHFISFDEEKSEGLDDDEVSSSSMPSSELSESDIIPGSQEKIKLLEKFVSRIENNELRKSEDNSLFFIKQDNWIRLKIKHIVESFCFKQIIRALVWLYLILKGIDTMYMDKNGLYSDAVYEAFSLNLELTIFTVFLLEVIMKIIAHGFILGPHTFVQNYFNVFALILVICYFMGRNATENNFITYVKFFVF